jgi:hypothetical protein
MVAEDVRSNGERHALIQMVALRSKNNEFFQEAVLALRTCVPELQSSSDRKVKAVMYEVW